MIPPIHPSPLFAQSLLKEKAAQKILSKLHNNPYRISLHTFAASLIVLGVGAILHDELVTGVITIGIATLVEFVGQNVLEQIRQSQWRIPGRLLQLEEKKEELQEAAEQLDAFLANGECATQEAQQVAALAKKLRQTSLTLQDELTQATFFLENQYPLIGISHMILL